MRAAQFLFEHKSFAQETGVKRVFSYPIASIPTQINHLTQSPAPPSVCPWHEFKLPKLPGHRENILRARQCLDRIRALPRRDFDADHPVPRGVLNPIVTIRRQRTPRIFFPQIDTYCCSSDRIGCSVTHVLAATTVVESSPIER